MVEGRDVAELLTGIASLKWPSRRTPGSMVVTSLTCRMQCFRRARAPLPVRSHRWRTTVLSQGHQHFLDAADADTVSVALPGRSRAME
ncbi:hypothetical protein GCM10022275_28790 [Tessaracoccus defluvii]